MHLNLNSGNVEGGRICYWERKHDFCHPNSSISTKEKKNYQATTTTKKMASAFKMSYTSLRRKEAFVLLLIPILFFNKMTISWI